jgi:hypothetical protein
MREALVMDNCISYADIDDENDPDGEKNEVEIEAGVAELEVAVDEAEEGIGERPRDNDQFDAVMFRVSSRGSEAEAEAEV